MKIINNMKEIDYDESWLEKYNDSIIKWNPGYPFKSAIISVKKNILIWEIDVRSNYISYLCAQAENSKESFFQFIKENYPEDLKELLFNVDIITDR